MSDDYKIEVAFYANYDDVIIIDYRNSNDPNMKVMQSYKIKKKYQKEIAQIMYNYNVENPVSPEWNRTVDSMVKEWGFHNFAYNLGYKQDRTADTDFNNNDEGKNFWDFLFR